MKRCLLALLLCLCMLPCAALAVDGAYLSGEDLRELEPAYETFLETLADLLIERELLPETDREAWILYQLGDYFQNGGFGSIMVMYTPGLLNVADESVTMRRFSLDTGAGGTLYLETLRRYAEAYSPLPGLPLDTDLLDENGAAIPCRFRWTASGGSFMIWDGSQETVVNVGATYINDDKPLYWYEEPIEGIEETLTLEILYAEEDRTIATMSLLLVSGSDFWAPEVLK